MKKEKFYMGSFDEFKEGFQQFTENPQYSNIDVRGHFECPHCKTSMQLLWHFYPNGLIKSAQGKFGKYKDNGFSFMGVEFFRKPNGEFVDFRGEDGHINQALREKYDKKQSTTTD